MGTSCILKITFQITPYKLLISKCSISPGCFLSMLLGILVFASPWTPRLAYLQKWDGFRLLSGKPSGTLAQTPLFAKERMKIKHTYIYVFKKKGRARAFKWWKIVSKLLSIKTLWLHPQTLPSYPPKIWINCRWIVLFGNLSKDSISKLCWLRGTFRMSRSLRMTPNVCET